jgi:hypothetical protein
LGVLAGDAWWSPQSMPIYDETVADLIEHPRKAGVPADANVVG